VFWKKQVRYRITFVTLIKMCTIYITERIFDCSVRSQATLKRDWLKFMLRVLIISSQGAKDTEYLNTVFLLKANSRHFRGLFFLGGGEGYVSCLIQEVDNVKMWFLMCVLWPFCLKKYDIWIVTAFLKYILKKKTPLIQKQKLFPDLICG